MFTVWSLYVNCVDYSVSVLFKDICDVVWVVVWALKWFPMGQLFRDTLNQYKCMCISEIHLCRTSFMLNEKASIPCWLGRGILWQTSAQDSGPVRKVKLVVFKVTWPIQCTDCTVHTAHQLSVINTIILLFLCCCSTAGVSWTRWHQSWIKLVLLMSKRESVIFVWVKFTDGWTWMSWLHKINLLSIYKHIWCWSH